MKKQLNNHKVLVTDDDTFLRNEDFLRFAKARFAARNFRYNVDALTDPISVFLAINVWVFEVSKFKPSRIEFLPHITDYSGALEMARPKKDAKTAPAQQSDKFKGFINIRLSEDDGIALDALFKKPNIREIIEFLLDWGKLSISFNKEAFNVTTVISDGDLQGHGVSSYAPEYIQALVVQAYKLDQYGENLGDFVTSSPNRPLFG